MVYCRSHPERKWCSPNVYNCAFRILEVGSQIPFRAACCACATLAEGQKSSRHADDNRGSCANRMAPHRHQKDTGREEREYGFRVRALLSRSATHRQFRFGLPPNWRGASRLDRLLLLRNWGARTKHSDGFLYRIVALTSSEMASLSPDPDSRAWPSSPSNRRLWIDTPRAQAEKNSATGAVTGVRFLSCCSTSDCSTSTPGSSFTGRILTRKMAGRRRPRWLAFTRRTIQPPTMSARWEFGGASGLYS